MNKLMPFISLLLIAQLVFAQEEVFYSDAERVPVGSIAPGFSGIDLQGEQVNSKEILKEDKLVLVFYRGVWCGYCMDHLQRLQDSLNLLADAGARVVVVTPEQPTFIRETIDKSGAQFSIISDPEYKIMEDYGVAFSLSKETVPRYFNIVVNKTRKSNGNEEDVLPVPATFIVNLDGSVLWRYFDVDYTKRPSVARILEVLDKE